MKTFVAFTLVATLAVSGAFAAEKKAAEKKTAEKAEAKTVEKAEPAPADSSADAAKEAAKKESIRRAGKKPFYTNLPQAIEAADAFDQPIIALLLTRDEIAQDLKRGVTQRKEFKEFCVSNAVVLQLNVPTDRNDRFDPSGIRDENLKKFYVGASAAGKGGGNGFPCIVCATPAGVPRCRAGKYDKAMGFGTWINAFISEMQGAGFKPVTPASVAKAIAEPAPAMKSSGSKKTSKKK